MVAIGSGGIFAGITYTDEEGQLRGPEDYILNRLPVARGLQYQKLFWNIKGHRVLSLEDDSTPANIV